MHFFVGAGEISGMFDPLKMGIRVIGPGEGILDIGFLFSARGSSHHYNLLAIFETILSHNYQTSQPQKKQITIDSSPMKIYDVRQSN